MEKVCLTQEKSERLLKCLKDPLVRLVIRAFIVAHTIYYEEEEWSLEWSPRTLEVLQTVLKSKVTGLDEIISKLWDNFEALNKTSMFDLNNYRVYRNKKGKK